MATKAAITKVLSCALVFVILMSVMPVPVFAVNDSNYSTGNASNRSNELVNSFMVNNSAEVMIPLFNNNTTDNYRAWSEEDNRSGDCAPIPDANMPVIYLNDTQESVASQGSGNDADVTILHDISNDTARTVSALSCSVYIKIDDDTCVGYEVYVDGVYKLTEGEGGTPDGYCAFYVSAGTHTIEIRKNGRSASITKNFECGYTYRWVSMPDYWCENGDHGDEVKFRGVVIGTSPEGLIGAIHWYVSVDEWISGSLSCAEIDVIIGMYPPFGSWDENICKGDRVEAYGEVNPWGGDECTVGLNGESYYIKKISSELLSINVWTDKSEYKIGETVTIYYQTNKKCTAKLTITKPDGGDVVYGPNEIPASTRSKSATAGYPTGKRTVVFEAWAGDEYKKATCYFDVVDEEEWEVKFQGTVNSTYPEETYFSCEVRIDKIISDPDDCIEEGWIVDIVLGDSPCGSYEEVKKGDKIEVFGKRLLVYSFPPQISLCGKSSYYLKKIDSETLTISVWTDKSEYKIGETVTIYYKTNKKCTAKLTITKPDGGDVVYGPNEIPASTRSKSSTAGYPTGKRTVVFEAWDGAEYKKATCYFDVVEEEECEVKFGGIVMDIRGTTPWVQVDKVISGSEYISGGDYTDIACYTTAGETGPCGHCDIVKKGDRVEVYGKRLPIYQIPMVISICGKTSYYMRMIGKPDLVIEDISWSPSKPKQGDTVTINVKIKNQGSENAEGFYVCYYVDGSYYTRDYISSLSAGSTTTTSFTWTAESGSHSIKAYADCYDAIDESNEGNNEKSIIIEVGKKPDEIKFIGTFLNHNNPMGFTMYFFKVDEVVESSMYIPVGDEIRIMVYCSAVPDPLDNYDLLDIGDRAEVYAKFPPSPIERKQYDPWIDREVWVASTAGDEKCYVRKIEPSPKTIYVDDDFVVDDPSNHKWNTIQKGINDANDGDTILVYPGTYIENVDVTKSLTIKSTSGNPEDTIVHAAVSNQNYQNVFTVAADNVHIDGFTIKGASYLWCSGMLIGGGHCVISNNTFEENAIGIWTHPPSGTDNTIRNNNFASTSEKSPSTALYIEATGNKIYLNNFFIGTMGGGSYFSTLWNSPEKITYTYNGKTFTSYLGNYWDDYKDKYPSAKENDNTGIWDTPYEIDEDKDYYPLEEGFENYIPVTGKPDLIITDIYSTWGCIGYQIKNQGTKAAADAYNRWLYINDREKHNSDSHLITLPLDKGKERKILWTSFSSLTSITRVKVCIEYDGWMSCREEQWSKDDVNNILRTGKSRLEAIGVEDMYEKLPEVKYPAIEPMYLNQRLDDDTVEKICIPANYTQDDFAILHEYGHFLEDRWYIIATMSSDCPSGHEICQRSGKKCAMKEGWAHFLSCLARNSSKWGEYHDFPLPDFEHPFIYCPLNKCLENEECEVIVAAIFWDLSDPYNSTEKFDKIEIPATELVSLIKKSMWGGIFGFGGSDGLKTFYINFNAQYEGTDLPSKFDTLLKDGYGIDYSDLKSKSIKASLSSPANLHAYDSQGNHVGMNATGGFDLQIPDSYYTGPDSEPEEIIIFGQSENVKFKVEGLEEGKFNLTITQSTEAGTKKIIYNDVPIAETTEATVDVSEANPTYILEIDTDGDGTTDEIKEPDSIDVIGHDSYSLQLHIGWNLISLPLTPEDTNVLNVLNSVEGNWNSVWSYEGGRWKRYDLAGPDFLNTLTFMEPGKGYWLHMKSDDTLSISGSEPRVKSIPLSAGWNLVGYNSLNSMPTTEAMSSVAANWNSVWSYETGNWKRYDLMGPDFLNSLTFMEPGKGYWLNMKSPDTWTLGA